MIDLYKNCSKYAKNIPMILLLITPYVFLGIVLTTGFSKYIFPIWGIACLFILLPNMIYAFLLLRMKYTERELFFWNMLLKLCNIPVFVFVFILGLLMSVFVIPLLIFLVIFDYSLLLPSTMYGISGLLKSYQKHRISLVKLIVNFIMQFLFCFDVFSSIYLYFSSRKMDK